MAGRLHRRVRAPLPVHQIRAGNARTQRQTRGDPLGNADHIGLHAIVLEREHFTRATHTALYFIDDQKDWLPGGLAQDLEGLRKGDARRQAGGREILKDLYLNDA